MITISINPQNATHIAILAKAMSEMLTAENLKDMVQGFTATPAKPSKKEKVAEAPKPVDAPSGATVPAGPTSTTTDTKSTTDAPKPITLEEVRAKLAALSQGGKTTAVKELIGSFGVGKLTDLKVEQYAAVLEKAEAL